ncbi:hypothetical protein fugu_001116 [Takifugu bimaculatus]|uniref:Sulfotransferase n=1 Tax=Takifugu bimaculatus TaxID=433685 RepID=A0A4Z2CIM1_9TELE|nr:hypothetical protein fugu_001116 [Takifugu bimaculatus]
MGCSKWRAAFNFGHLKAQSKLSVFFTMIILFTYLFYCLSGYCDSAPRPVYVQQTSFQSKFLLSDGPAASSQQPDARNASRVSFVREQLPDLSPSNMSIANNFGSKKFPQAIIIGVKKGGTRALLEFLRIHPDVRAVGTEPHFFDRFYDKGLEWYRNLMPRTLEGSDHHGEDPQLLHHQRSSSPCLLHEPSHQADRGGAGPCDTGRFRLYTDSNQVSWAPILSEPGVS